MADITAPAKKAFRFPADAGAIASIMSWVAAVTAAINGLRQAPTARSGAGAVPITSPYCLFTSTGAAQALTVADGTYAGQEITIWHVVDGGSGVITQTTGAKLRADITTITFTNVGDWVTLVWTGTLWTPVKAYGATIATS